MYCPIHYCLEDTNHINLINTFLLLNNVVNYGYYHKIFTLSNLCYNLSKFLVKMFNNSSQIIEKVWLTYNETSKFNKDIENMINAL